MLPFITLFGRALPTYTILGLLGIVLAVFVVSLRAKRYGFVRSDAVYIAAFAGLGLVAGGVLLHALTQMPHMLRASVPLFSRAALAYLFGGMVFYGGLFGTFGGLWFYARFMKAPLGRVMALVVPVFPLAHAVMRVGCFMGGCCYGIPHPPPLGIAFSQSLGAPNGVHLLPVQLYEAAANLLLFWGIWRYTAKERDWVYIICLYGTAYGVLRFCLEFLRGDLARGIFWGLSTSQWISIVVLVLSIGGWYLRAKTISKGKVT